MIFYNLPNHKVEKVDSNGNWTLWIDGKQAVGFQRLNDGRLVYYDPSTGIMLHGNKIINNHEYTFDNVTGAVHTGW